MKPLSSSRISSLLPEKEFLHRVFAFSIPIALQNMSSAILGIIDVSIISSMGEIAVSSVALANQLFYIVSLITFGITSGASVFLARSYGQKDPSSMRKNTAIMLFFSLLINALIMILCLFAPRTAVGLFTNDANTIAGGALYITIIAPTFVLYSVINSCSSFFRSVHLPKIPMITTIVSLLAKVLLNLILIHGFGFIPAMGITGAAISTLISRLIELGLYLFFLLRFQEKEYVFRFGDIRYIRPHNCLRFLKNTYPVILNESLWGLGLTSFSAIWGRMGNDVVSAVSIAQQLENLGNSFFYGIGIGACVSLSFSIGANQLDQAREDAKKYASTAFLVGCGIMLLMLAIDIPYVNIFFSDLEPGTKALAKGLIAVYAVYMPFRSLASALIMGLQRAGGDSQRGMLYDVLPVYLWATPIGFLLGLGLHLPVVFVLAAMQFKRVIKCATAFRRMRSGKWLNLQKPQAAEEKSSQV